jgi:fucose permease
MNSNGRTLPLFAGAAAGIAIYGIAFAVLGTVLGLPEMRAHLHMDAVHEGNLFSLLYMGVFLSNALIGPIIDAVGSKKVLILSALMVSVSLIWFSSLTTFAEGVCAAVILGFGGGSLNVSVNALVSAIYPTKRGSMLNLLGVFFGVGALSVPLAATTLLTHMGITGLFWLAASLSAVGAVYYGAVSFPISQVKRGLVLLDTVRVLRYPGVLQIGILLFFENADEAVIAAWTSIYVGSLGCKPRTATIILGCYWASMMAGRIIASQLIKRIGKLTIVIGAAMGGVLGCALLFLSTTPVSLALAAIITGLSFAPIFKTALSIAGDRHPQATASIFGVVFAMSLIGAMIAPWLVGQISHHYSIRYGPLVPLLGSICVGAMTLLIGRSVRRDREAEGIVSSPA